MANVDAYVTNGGDFSSEFSIRGPVGEFDAYLSEYSVKDYSSIFFHGDVPITPISLKSIVQNGLACFRLTYTIAPIQLDVNGLNDALNPDNYHVTGPISNSVTSVVPVIHDPTSVDIYLLYAVVTGTWTIKVKNVEAP